MVKTAHNGLVAGSSPAGPTTYSVRPANETRVTAKLAQREKPAACANPSDAAFTSAFTATGRLRIADTLPPMPSHVLMLSWHPPAQRPDMAFSLEGRNYLALYGEWKSAGDDARYENWATEHMQAMAPLSKGIQLADENLGRRRAPFMRADNLARLDALRAKYDPQGRFHSWKGQAG